MSVIVYLATLLSIVFILKSGDYSTTEQIFIALIATSLTVVVMGIAEIKDMLSRH